MGKKAPVILQMSDTECGVASLAMLFAYYKVYISIEELRDKCGVSRDGCKAQTLITVAHEYGFEATAYQVDLDTIKKLAAPVIAHWKFSHYIVINHANKVNVFINDPAFGARTISIDEFGHSFTGIIINVSPKNIEKRRCANYSREMIKHFFSTQYSYVLFIFLCLFASNTSSGLYFSAYRALIDHYIKTSTLLTPIMLLILIFSVISLFTTLLYKLVLNKLTTMISILHTSEIVAHLIKLPLLFYSLRHRSEMLALLSRVETLAYSLYKNTVNILIGLMGIISCVILMKVIDPTLCLCTVIFSLLYISLTFYITSISFYHEKTHTYLSAKLHAYSTTILRNIETVKSCGMEWNVLTKRRSLYFNLLNAQQGVRSLNALAATLTKSYSLFAVFLILVIGDLSPSSRITYYALYFLFYSYLNTFLTAHGDIKRNNEHYCRIRDIHIYNADQRHNCKPIPSNRTATSNEIISCHNVSYFYNKNSTPVIINLNAKIYINQLVAVVGKTGSGKSSLAKLLCALYKPTSGVITLFGNNILDYTAEELAKLCSYVSQDVSLFSETLLHNLTLGKAFSAHEIDDAIQTTCLSNVIIERGLNAIVEEAGSNFSGGEKQRIDIARALLQNTPLLILDEATSALDNKTENIIITNLKRLNKTIVLVTHRESSLQYCDQIIRLNHGEVI